MRFLTAALFVAASPCLAEPMAATDCHIWPDGAGSGLLFVECSTTNSSASAVASAFFRIIAVEPGRTVPWIDDKGSMKIDGGVEPGETRAMVFTGGIVSDKTLAIPGLSFSVEVTKVLDVNGAEIQ